jgi:predicted peroxiredoxin
MTNYIFIETRDPFDSADTRFVEETAAALRQRGNDVTIFLLQNGVFASRQNGRESTLSRMALAGVKILADDFSLCERGIQKGELAPGIELSSIETLVDSLMQENTKAIWH